MKHDVKIYYNMKEQPYNQKENKKWIRRFLLKNS